MGQNKGISPSWWDKLTDTRPKRTEDIHLPSDSDIGKHPIGLPESAIERLIKKYAKEKGTYLGNEDAPYLEQYLHPDYDVLPRQELRPTIGTPENIPYRHLHTKPVMGPDPEEMKQAIDKFAKREINTIDVSKMKQTLQNWNNTTGLGHYKFDQSNPNYDSIYDKWDFDTKTPLYKTRNLKEVGTIAPSLDAMIKMFMERVGKPYAVYERIPKNSHNPQ